MWFQEKSANSRWVEATKQPECIAVLLQASIITGFPLYFSGEIQGLFKDFQGP